MQQRSIMAMIGLAALLSIFVSCEKRYELGTLDSFDVKTERDTYSVGDSVKFSFTGGAENIVFWSGEDGHVYDFKDRTVIEGNSLLLNFRTFSQFGEVDQSNMSLLISSDFSGIYDSAHVRNASWKDITDRAVFSSGLDQTKSGEINLDEFAAANADMVLAFRYKTSEVKQAATQNRWVIRSIDLTSVTAGGSITPVFNMKTAGWISFNFSGTATDWIISSSQLITSRNYVDLDDDWIVSKVFNPNKVSPDQGIVLKNISQSLSEYTTVYDKPGTYNVAFVATNANVKNSASRIIRKTITVVE